MKANNFLRHEAQMNSVLSFVHETFLMIYKPKISAACWLLRNTGQN